MKKPLFLIITITLISFINVYCQNDNKKETISASIMDIVIGTQAPEWSLKDINGETFKLSNYKGKLVLLELWGTGCGACVKVAKDVCEIDSIYKEKGLVVFGIEADGRSNTNQIIDFKNKYGLNYKTLIGNKQLMDQYHAIAYPTFYLIDKTGKIIYSHLGFFYGDSKNKLIETINRCI